MMQRTILLSSLLLATPVSSFVPSVPTSLPTQVCGETTSSYQASTSTARDHDVDNDYSTVSITTGNRRAFVQTAAAALLGSALTTSLPVRAEDSVDDLAMPTPEEEKARADAEMAERLARKRELQKKASRPASYGASLKFEKEKQSELKKSQAEKRAAMCEELGRGC